MITACVLNCNGKAVLERCLSFLEKQYRKPDEIILVDNGSTDDSWKLVENRVSRVVHADNKFKFITGLNESFRAAKDGEVLFMSNDIFLFYRCIHDLSQSDSEIKSPIQYSKEGFKYKNITFSTACFMMSKGLFEIVGDFDENLAPAYYEDVDYAIRAKRFGCTIDNKVGECVHWASHTFGDMYKKKQISMWCRRHAWYVFRKHYLSRVAPWLYTSKTYEHNTKKVGSA